MWEKVQRINKTSPKMYSEVDLMPADKTAKHAFQATIRERRKQMLRSHFRGIPTTEWVATLATEYGVEPIAIWQDWRRRKSWIADVFELADVADEINMSMAKLKDVEEEAWRACEKATNSQSKAAALNIISRVVKDRIEILQSLGMIYKEPEKIKIEGRVAVVELLKVYAPIAERIGAGPVPKNNSGK